MTLIRDKTSPRRDATIGTRGSSRAGQVLVVVASLTVLLSSCTTDNPEPSTDLTSATSGAVSSSEAPSTPAAEPTTTTPPAPASTSPQQQAAAAAEDAYRRNTVEGFRHLNTAIQEAATQWGGNYVRTPELDAILQAVATDPDYNARANEPALVLQDAPTAIGSAGAPVVTGVRIDTVEFYDPPRTITDQGGITTLVTLTACKDVTSVKTLGPDGSDLFPESGTRILRETVTVRQQPHFITGTPGWYVATRTNVEDQTCDLS